ncbi:MAG: TetR/AcrR family transcriptional regulator, partial [Deltaproteobacteria bacterium]|nr:TetR/AcrR family transcriptional regulator [Deltaproteobacteria bacterium]
MGTQAQIVALAVYQLKSGGYEELHFGAIASALGVTRANIHHHFSSKRNLAQVALEEFVENRLCLLRAMIDRYPSDFPSALDSIGEYLQKLYSDHP